MDIRLAKRGDEAAILALIRAIAEYEKLSDEVVATTQLLTEWLFEKKVAQVYLATLSKDEAQEIAAANAANAANAGGGGVCAGGADGAKNTAGGANNADNVNNAHGAAKTNGANPNFAAPNSNLGAIGGTNLNLTSANGAKNPAPAAPNSNLPHAATTPNATFAPAQFLRSADGEIIAGYALFFYNFSTFLARGGIYLEDLFVFPEFRAKGYGKALLRQLARRAASEGCGRIEWCCLNWNTPSIEFYLSLGARRMSEWNTYRLTHDEIAALAGS